jgi:hypothetical protein
MRCQTDELNVQHATSPAKVSVDAGQVVDPLATDLQASTMRAFHDGDTHADEVYDDDYGGALYVAGGEGLQLPPIDESQNREAIIMASAIFRGIQQNDQEVIEMVLVGDSHQDLSCQRGCAWAESSCSNLDFNWSKATQRLYWRFQYPFSADRFHDFARPFVESMKHS